MEYFVKSGKPEKQRVGTVVVGVFDRRKLSEAAATLDQACGGIISNVMRRGDIDGKPGQTLLLQRLDGMFCDRVLLIGLGKERDFDDQAFRKANIAAIKALKPLGGVDAVSFLTSLKLKGRTPDWMVKQAQLASASHLYRFDQCKSKPGKNRQKLERYTFDVPSRADLPDAEQALTQAEAISEGLHLTRDLANLPGNICTPTYLAEQAQQLSKTHKTITCKILEESDMAALGMGALLSVSRGSRQPAKLIIMEFLNAPDKSAKPTLLVGKGLTFDAGGISIKPAAAMDEMKYDMCGGASVFGTIQAIASLDLPINVVGIVPSSENLPDGDANKPGDIVTSMAGITIEVLNTDAEGRLILCDALTYAQENYDAEAIIDMATLTGACVIALGSHASALFANKEKLAKALLAAGETAGDRAWRMPLWEDYQQQLKSPFADVANVGGRNAGAITAACFLHRFTRKANWAHLDIAGSAWNSGSNKGATGRPVSLLVEYLLAQASS